MWIRPRSTKWQVRVAITPRCGYVGTWQHVVAFWRFHALVPFPRVLLRGGLLRKLRPALRLGRAGAHLSHPVRLAPVPRAVVVARERPVWAVQPRRRLRAALARWRLRSAERAARGRLRDRP